MFLIALSTQPHIAFDQTFLIRLLPYFTYPAVHIASTASAIMTVALAHERYLAVQAPIVYSQMLRRASAQRRRLAMHVLPVLLFAILFNMPTFWCVENCCGKECYSTPSTNNTISEDHNNITTVDLNILENVPRSENTLFKEKKGVGLIKESLSNPTVIEIPNSTTLVVKNQVPNTNKETSSDRVDQNTFNSDWNQMPVPKPENDALLRTVEVDETSLNNETNNDTYLLEENCQSLGFRFTAFRSHPYFIMFYQNIARLVVLGILPFAMLIFFNCSIYFAIRRRRGNLKIFRHTVFHKCCLFSSKRYLKI